MKRYCMFALAAVLCLSLTGCGPEPKETGVLPSNPISSELSETASPSETPVQTPEPSESEPAPSFSENAEPSAQVTAPPEMGYVCEARVAWDTAESFAYEIVLVSSDGQIPWGVIPKVFDKATAEETEARTNLQRFRMEDGTNTWLLTVWKEAGKTADDYEMRLDDEAQTVVTVTESNTHMIGQGNAPHNQNLIFCIDGRWYESDNGGVRSRDDNGLVEEWYTFRRLPEDADHEPFEVSPDKIVFLKEGTWEEDPLPVWMSLEETTVHMTDIRGDDLERPNMFSVAFGFRYDKEHEAEFNDFRYEHDFCLKTDSGLLVRLY